MKHKNPHVTLVYQGGMANVFDTSDGTKTRLLQGGFRDCETFVRGIRAMGIPASYAWCNKAGDIIDEQWNYESFGDMPFFDNISNDWEIR